MRSRAAVKPNTKASARLTAIVAISALSWVIGTVSCVIGIVACFPFALRAHFARTPIRRSNHPQLSSASALATYTEE